MAVDCRGACRLVHEACTQHLLLVHYDLLLLVYRGHLAWLVNWRHLYLVLLSLAILGLRWCLQEQPSSKRALHWRQWDISIYLLEVSLDLESHIS